MCGGMMLRRIGMNRSAVVLTRGVSRFAGGGHGRNSQPRPRVLASAMGRCPCVADHQNLNDDAIFCVWINSRRHAAGALRRLSHPHLNPRHQAVRSWSHSEANARCTRATKQVVCAHLPHIARPVWGVAPHREED